MSHQPSPASSHRLPHPQCNETDFVCLSLLQCHLHAPFSLCLLVCPGGRLSRRAAKCLSVQLSGPPSKAQTLPSPGATDACCPHVAGTSSVWFRVMFSSLPGQLHESSSSALPWWPQHTASVPGLGTHSTTCRCIKRQNSFICELFSVPEAFGGSCCPAEDKKWKSGPGG